MPQDGSPRRVSLVFPLILITIGVLFLVQSWRPAFEPWLILRDWWPALLILIGLGMVWDNVRKSRNPNPPPGISVGSTMGVLFFALLLVFVVARGRSYSRHHLVGSGSQHTSQTVEIQGAKSVQAKVEVGAGQLNISSGTNHLLESDFTFSDSFDEPRVSYSVADGVGQLAITQDSQSVHFGNSHNEWTLHFNNEIGLELRIDMGAGQGNLNFRNIPLTRLDLNLGAGQVDVDLTGDRTADLTADIEGGVGQANIRLPKNVGVIAHASGGIGSIRAHGLKEEGGSYTNEAYGKSKATIHLKVEGGIGEIVLTEE